MYKIISIRNKKSLKNNKMVKLNKINTLRGMPEILIIFIFPPLLTLASVSVYMPAILHSSHFSAFFVFFLLLQAF